MLDTIRRYIENIEHDYNCHVLLACETGSRAWGFSSPDSDYDIRLIYLHKKDWYLSLKPKGDTINLMFENNNIDISGWDLRKTLLLLNKSNGPLLEKIHSSIIYKSDESFLSEVKNLAFNQYSRIAVVHHYLSMAKKFLFEMKSKDSYRLKTLFYALRCACACKWILENNEIVPIEFQKILLNIGIHENLLNQISELIQLKEKVKKKYVHKGEVELIKYIEECIYETEKRKISLPGSNGKVDDLNSFFIKTLDGYDNR